MWDHWLGQRQLGAGARGGRGVISRSRDVCLRIEVIGMGVGLLRGGCGGGGDWEGILMVMVMWMVWYGWN